MFNKVIFIGRLTKDPTLRYTPQGVPVATIPLAVNTVIGGQDKKEETLFIDVVTFNRTAERAAEYLVRGKPILVEGRLTCRKWEGNDGNVHQKYEVVASQIKFLPTGKNDNQHPAGEEVGEVEENDLVPADPF